ncbi:MAG TPA: hypothetical protein VF033_16680 [Steroidobacteraceae bacterium]
MWATRTLTGFLIFEVILFAFASLMHAGLLLPGHVHARAAIAEAVIAAVLTLGLVIMLVRPAIARRAALVVQGFAVLGVLVGLMTIAIGIGPRTVPDLVIHAVMLITLVAGVLAALRTRPA